MINTEEAFQEFRKTLAYAMKYVLDNQIELTRKYELKYLAIAEGRGVIDSDEDKKFLILRKFRLRKLPTLVREKANGIFEVLKNPNTPQTLVCGFLTF